MKRRSVLLWVTALVVLVAVATGTMASAGERTPIAGKQPAARNDPSVASAARASEAAGSPDAGSQVTTGPITSAGERDAGNQIAGTWRVTVNRPAPQTPLISLQVFTSDGSVIENANEWPATRTESYGVWERIGGRLYANSTEFFRFNPQTGAQVGTMKINRTIRLSQDGQTMSVVARATLVDLSGNVVTSFLVRATGVRMQVERIPDLP
jgi:hypothetical protein